MRPNRTDSASRRLLSSPFSLFALKAKLAVWLTATLCSGGYILAQGYPAEEAAGKMWVTDGFEVQLVASEPQVRQPVSIDFDNKGRLWVMEYLQYPNPAGLERVKVDRYSRTTYDRVPEPPPHGPRGADRLTILEDKDGDGICESAKDFVDGLNLATGFTFGNGGVYVLQTPYLLFYPDRNQDDVPDSDPEVLLSGFGMEDTSSLANSLMFGPDGWLYGTQGTNIQANIRGVQFEQGVWRYHHARDQFELFCEGGGNSWGLDFDAAGNLFYSTNHGGYVMHHGVQGAYLEKAFAKHGELHNPFAFGYFKHVPHENFQGGHVTVGGLVYQADAFPAKYRGKYFGADTLGHGVYFNDVITDGATFKTAFADKLVLANDTWCAPSDMTMGPDGTLYFCDWHDQRTAHPDPDADWDKSNGRIYRISPVGMKSTEHQNPAEQSSAELIEWLKSDNSWMVRRARLELASRKDQTVEPTLLSWLKEPTPEKSTLAREALWTLYSMDAWPRITETDPELINRLLTHSDPVIRTWTVRFVGDQYHLAKTEPEAITASKYLPQLILLAEQEMDPVVVSQLACTAKRIPAEPGLQLASRIASRMNILTDAYIPLLVWWAVEEHAMEAPELALQLFASPKAWENEFVRTILIGRLMRRFAGEGSSQSLHVAAHLFNTAPDAKSQQQLLAELNSGLKMLGKEQISGLPLTGFFNQVAVVKQEEAEAVAVKLESQATELSQTLQRIWEADRRNPLLLEILIRLSSDEALQQALQLATNQSLSVEDRIAALTVLEQVGDERVTAPLLNLIQSGEPEPVALKMLDVLARHYSEEVGDKLLTLYQEGDPNLKPSVLTILIAHPETTLSLLRLVDQQELPDSLLTTEQLRQLALHNMSDIDDLVRKHWGSIQAGTAEEKLAEIRRIMNDLRAAEGNPEQGKTIYKKICANCHKLFGEGNVVGPDLTRANRHDQLFLLTSIIDPSVQIRKEYLRYVLVTTGGRLAVGLLVEETDSQITLLDEKNQKIVIPAEEVDELTASNISLMPENLLKPLSPQELRDLYAYLQSKPEPQP
ncbi:Cytochrome c [Polystyrenella longa]|uniref:Cytochrome c n=1 Tax=Polystyrenella longa TaxID=2528007 RepID=A0A518CLY3_9PLAN|nr:PVC-type heme-binding CxxCH protein [Polystyrenella longa]QDU80194.1 Cytochrome c [Polystyrenella longa]